MSAMKLIKDSPVAQSFFIRLVLVPHGKLMHLLPDRKFSHPCSYLQHLLHPFRTSLSYHSQHLIIPPILMDAPSRLAEVDSPTIPPVLHICETFHPSDECNIYDANLIWTILSKSYHHSFIYANKYPELPLPASYTSPRMSMDSIHHIILETHINRPSWEFPFLHYIDCLPKQSARIPLPHYIPLFGYFSRNILGCFVMTSDSFKKGDVV